MRTPGIRRNGEVTRNCLIIQIWPLFELLGWDISITHWIYCICGPSGGGFDETLDRALLLTFDGTFLYVGISLSLNLVHFYKPSNCKL